MVVSQYSGDSSSSMSPTGGCLLKFDPPQSAVSEAVTVYAHKLSLRPCLDAWPDTWHNQMGGATNCIILNVEILDVNGNVDESRRGIPLRITLLHDDLTEVRTQERQPTSTEGRSLLRVRVTEVSRRHQNRPFRFRVEPDGCRDPLSRDVNAVISLDVMVLVLG